MQNSEELTRRFSPIATFRVRDFLSDQVRLTTRERRFFPWLYVTFIVSGPAWLLDKVAKDIERIEREYMLDNVW